MERQHAITGTRTQGVSGQTTSVTMVTGAASVVVKATSIIIATKTDITKLAKLAVN